jgi:predicted lysophospholipase L1 biosynthesis ABC-type transport system permease subunit
MSGLQTHQFGDAGQDRAGKTLAGDINHPLWAVVSSTFAGPLHLQIGDRFALSMPGAVGQSADLTVGAIVADFPTLYPTSQPGGFVVLNLYDTLGAIRIAGQGSAPDTGPNEYWLKSNDPAATARAATSAAGTLGLDHTLVRTTEQAGIASNPIQAGMRGLLLVGAFTAAALAVLGTVVQSALAARQRAVQFAVLRTIGMTGGQLSQVLLSEQVMVYLVGLLGGSALGAVLATATLPFLQFGDTSLNAATLGIPPYRLAIDPLALLWFYAALLLACAVALVIAARFAARVGLGKTLRLGED